MACLRTLHLSTTTYVHNSSDEQSVKSRWFTKMNTNTSVWTGDYTCLSERSKVLHMGTTHDMNQSVEELA
jgi:hypothetical protein